MSGKERRPRRSHDRDREGVRPDAEGEGAVVLGELPLARRSRLRLRLPSGHGRSVRGRAEPQLPRSRADLRRLAVADRDHHDRVQSGGGSHGLQTADVRRVRAAGDLRCGNLLRRLVRHVVFVRAQRRSRPRHRRGRDQPDLRGGLSQGKDQVADDPARGLASGLGLRHTGDHRHQRRRITDGRGLAVPRALDPDPGGPLRIDVHPLQVPGGRARPSRRPLHGDAEAGRLPRRFAGVVHDGVRTRQSGDRTWIGGVSPQSGSSGASGSAC